MAAEAGDVHERAGKSVAAALRYWKIEPEEMLVATTSWTCRRAARLKFDGGHGGQNGLRDIHAPARHGKFHRGCASASGHPGHKDKVTPWVLGRLACDDDARSVARHRRRLGADAAAGGERQ